MAGILTTTREALAEFLRSDVASGAKAFFTDHAKPIGVFTEKLKSFEDKITAALTSTGIAAIVATPTAKDAKTEPGKLRLGKTSVLIRVLESPNTNDTGVSASDLAEVIVEFVKDFRVLGTSLAFSAITLGNDKTRLCYDVIFSASLAGTVNKTRA